MEDTEFKEKPWKKIFFFLKNPTPFSQGKKRVGGVWGNFKKKKFNLNAASKGIKFWHFKKNARVFQWILRGKGKNCPPEKKIFVKGFGEMGSPPQKHKVGQEKR